MGELNRLLITGAAGFIGRATVAEARARGQEVIAVIRSTAPADWQEDAGIETLHCDLSQDTCVPDLAEAMRRCDAVIHAAAHLGGDSSALGSDTLVATRNLLRARPEGLPLVLVSSITVYDTDLKAPGALIDEDTPLFAPGTAPDGYANAKLAQEALCREAGGPLWILRPGAVWGKGRSWNALIGVALGPLVLRIDSGGELPLTHVSQTASTLVNAALTAPHGTTAVNILDDDRPTRARFCAAHGRETGWPRICLPMPWRLWAALARILAPVGPRLPGLLRLPSLRARVMPLRYSNAALRRAFGGADTAPFEEMLAQTLREQTP